MNYEQIVVEKKGLVSIITINRPEAMNALQPQTHFELEHAFDTFEDDDTSYAAILTGAGKKAFSAGNDLKYSAKHGSGAVSEAMNKLKHGFAGITERFTNLKPIIAAVNGYALGGGTEIALACDLVVAADTATFALPEVKVGVIALAGGLYRLPRFIPYKKAMEMALTGRSVSAQEAHALGFVNQVVPRAELMAAALNLADSICENSPLAVRATKQAISESLKYPIEECFDRSKYPAVQIFMGSEDIKEGPRAFAEKRRPVWKCR